jgi:septal ring factor EnvC (AmiA/AmiB activator)
MALARSPVHLIIRDMSIDTVVAILALVGVIAVPIVSALIQRRDRGAKVISDMTSSQADLQDQIDKLDKRLIDMYAQNQQVEDRVARQQSRMASQQRAIDDDTAYIRSIAHWLQQACEVMDIPDEWSRSHPKPHLPDSIRSRIAKKLNEEDKNE